MNGNKVLGCDLPKGRIPEGTISYNKEGCGLTVASKSIEKMSTYLCKLDSGVVLEIMSKFVIEEQLTNSTHRDAQGEPVTEVLFTVVSWSGRNFLYKGKFIESEWLGENKLAECVNGDYKERFGGLRGWLKHVLKRERKNVESYTQQIKQLREKLEYSARLRWDISEVVRDEQ